MRLHKWLYLFAVFVSGAPLPAGGDALAADAPPANVEAAGAILAKSYPDWIERIEDGQIVWKSGGRLALDDGKGKKTGERWLGDPDPADMLDIVYPRAPTSAPVAPGQDPGRARNQAFFAHMYGNCRKDGKARELVAVTWLPKKSGQKVTVTKVNGVAARLKAISAELDELPAQFDAYLMPSAGGYVCRPIAGTDRLSGHGFGIAVDIATAKSDYWRWARPKGSAESFVPTWRNRIPQEIIDVFEKHGFIWGGKWHHFDTMHFEYRPELLPPKVPVPAG
ncbi:MAG: M15 family metallopeptidase [Hyphomicrobiaceae bacterium]|nr:M15 family metallopeptidase [Hyphomicrobiaceae bacterium]